MDAFTEAHVIPEGIENPTPILFWEPMEFVLALMFMGFGIIASLWVLGAGLASAVLVFAPRMRRGTRRGAVPHLLWAKGLTLDPNLKRWFKPAWLNDYSE